MTGLHRENQDLAAYAWTAVIIAKAAYASKWNGKMADDVDAVMHTIPEEWRERWCGAIERGGGGCACMGCVQIGNRLIMAGRKVTQCDPEYIDESKIPPEVFKKYKITKEEWAAWIQRQGH